jgi:hypothetical protein
MSGACNGAVDVYQSFPGVPAGWYPTCGTSEATPLFAGIVSLADQVAGHPLGLINPALYTMSATHAPGIVDVTSGNNTVSFTQGGQLDTVTGFSAARGTTSRPASAPCTPRTSSPSWRGSRAGAGVRAAITPGTTRGTESLTSHARRCRVGARHAAATACRPPTTRSGEGPFRGD